MSKETVKVICCDIDGTLVRNDKSLSEENIKWIHKAVHEAGVHFTLVSGRPVNGVLPFYRRMGITGPVSCFNGGTLVDDFAAIRSWGGDGAPMDIRGGGALRPAASGGVDGVGQAWFRCCDLRHGGMVWLPCLDDLVAFEWQPFEGSDPGGNKGSDLGGHA